MSKLFDLLGLGTGRNFYMRDFKNAYHFRPDVNPVRQKFQGYVNFVFNRDTFSQLYNEAGNDSNEFRTTISSLVRTAELPSVEFKTETVNRYNSKKIIQTGKEYSPVNFTVYDTVGNEWLTVLMKYFSYYYMDPRNMSDSSRDVAGGKSRIGGVDVVGTRFGAENEGIPFDSNSSGYNPQLTSNLFERIDYVLYHGNKGVQYSIINPFIKSFKPSDLDYSDSQYRDFQFTIEYEKFTVHNVTNFGLTAEDVDRFEDVSAVTGPAFEEAELSPAMDTRSIDVLGDANSPRFRTGQSIANSITPEIEEEVFPVYGEKLDFSSTAEEEEGGFFSDLLGNVADSVLTAAIHGGDIKDAALGAAVGSTIAAVGEVVQGGLGADTGITRTVGEVTSSSPNQPGDAQPPEGN